MTQYSPKWELYRDGCAQEDKLFENAIVEFTDISGIPIKYLVRDESIEMDRLFGETTETAYLEARDTKVVYDVTEEPTITDTFGISSIEMIQSAFMPKAIWARDVSDTYEPKPGDVIQTLWNNRNYEVVDVGEEDRIFKLNKFIYSFILKPYRFSEQSDSAKEVLSNTPFDNDDSTLTHPITAYGDNEFIQEQSDDIDDYSDVDEAIYNIR